MPEGVNHAAAGTDGKKLYVFGGRKRRNNPGPGFNFTQIYDPETNTWDSSSLPGSALQPLPAPRGGMGKAVYIPEANAFLVFGGESNLEAGAFEGLNDLHVTDRIDIYLVDENEWVLSSKTMDHARHGIYPVLFGDDVYVAGGGTKFRFSVSDIFSKYSV